jgi:hypothetical protein
MEDLNKARLKAKRAIYFQIAFSIFVLASVYLGFPALTNSTFGPPRPAKQELAIFNNSPTCQNKDLNYENTCRSLIPVNILSVSSGTDPQNYSQKVQGYNISFSPPQGYNLDTVETSFFLPQTGTQPKQLYPGEALTLQYWREALISIKGDGWNIQTNNYPTLNLLQSNTTKQELGVTSSKMMFLWMVGFLGVSLLMLILRAIKRYQKEYYPNKFSTSGETS